MVVKNFLRAHVFSLIALLVASGALVLPAIVWSNAPRYAVSSGNPGEPKTVTISGKGRIIAFGPLHVEGRYIKDVLNNTIHLRGTNFEAFEGITSYGFWPREGYEWLDGRTGYHEDGLRYTLRQMMEKWGFTCIRFQLHFDTIKFDADYRAGLRRVIEIMGEYGMYAVLAPNRITQGGGVNEHPPIPYPPYTNLTEIIADKQEFVDWWVDLATYLSDLPNWLIDPYNEPHKASAETFEEDKVDWFDAVARVIEGVRGVGCDHIILIQWQFGEWYRGEGVQHWAEDFIIHLEGLGLADNIMVSTHQYHDNFVIFRDFVDPRPPNTLEQLREDYEENNHLPDVARALNYPIMIGEVGFDEHNRGDDPYWTMEEEATWFTNVLTLFNEWGFHYLGWTWHPPQVHDYALLADSNWDNYDCTPSESGEILINAITGE